MGTNDNGAIARFGRRSRARLLDHAVWPAMLAGALVPPASPAMASDAHSLTIGATTCSSSGSGAETDYSCTTPLTNGGSGPSLAIVTNQDLGNGVGVVTSLTGAITGSGTTTTTYGNTGSSTVSGYVGNGTANTWPLDVPGTSTPGQKGPWTDGPDMAVAAGDVNILWQNGQAGPASGAISVLSQGGQAATNGNHNDNSHTSQYTGGDGGQVSLAFSGAIEISGNGGRASGSGSLPAAMIGLGAYSFGGSGGAYNTKNDCCVGDGGAGGDVGVSVAGGSMLTIDDGLGGYASMGIVALSQGGAPGQYDLVGASQYGQGGKAGQAGVLVDQSDLKDLSDESIGILAASIGGSGTATDGATAVAGSASTAAVQLEGSTVWMTGTDSVGIFALSAAGTFGTTSDAQPSGGDVYVLTDAQSEIKSANSATSGNQLSIGILAVSTGTASILSMVDLYGSNPSSGSLQTTGTGFSGDVTVVNAAPVTTQGSLAVGIAALSTGGASIVSGTGGSGLSYLGNQGTDYYATSGKVSLHNSGSITTTGANAHGLVAISTGGGGLVVSQVVATKDGDQWSQGTIIGAATDGDEPNGHDGNTVTVVNSGAITTGDADQDGPVSMGIVAQSIGGSGGSAGGEAVAFVGDQGGSGGNGGAVDVASNGKIFTLDKGSVGILAQSIGGGGGNGGNAKGLFVAVGGGGGLGGNGGDVTVTLGPQDMQGITVNPGVSGIAPVQTPSGTLGGSTAQVILTEADYAAAVIAQSVGGGGGHGGYADSFGVFIDASIGGNAGNGGSGGNVDVENHGSALVTQGNQAHGIIAQSIAGGGGTGGVAQSSSEGIAASASLSLGGQSGAGMNAGSVKVVNQGKMITGCFDLNHCQSSDPEQDYDNAGALKIDGADSIGILAQSIGGGGGHGGSASAKSEASSTDGIPTFAVSFSMGGKGSSGGSGGSIEIDNDGLLLTQGDGAHGILAQSIGGGGGHGGASTANATADSGDIGSFSASVSLGGSGGSGGNGGGITVDNGNGAGSDGSILTYGQEAVGILAQSIGGGGGNGALGNADGSISDEDDSDDDEGSGDEASASTSSAVFAAADDDDGGGSHSIGLTMAIGGSGGSGGSGNVIDVANDAGSRIRTLGSGSSGILAQSIGGGGGRAGGGTGNADGGDIVASITVGAKGGGGSGNTVNVTNAGSIVTGAIYENGRGQTVATGGDAYGILAQSIGGGGGIGGLSDPAASFDQGEEDQDATDGSDDDAAASAMTVLAAADEGDDEGPGTLGSYNVGIGIGVGGDGGVGGNGGTVQVDNSGQISTSGTRADGIVAQSIGGGGVAGYASSSSVQAEGGDVTSDLSLGGTNGAFGNAGSVTVANTGTISTTGYAAMGMIAQSIGGGGGIVAEGTSGSNALVTLGNVNDSGRSGGTGGSKVAITDVGSISTAGDDAYAVLAQLIGHGGGFATVGCSNSDAAGPSGMAAATPCFGNATGPTPAGWPDPARVTVGFGKTNANPGGSNAYASGASSPSVTIGSDIGTIVTTGRRAIALVAQSIGGGGGLVAAPQESIQKVDFDNGSSGAGGDIQLTFGNAGSNDARIATYGDGAWGMLVQSIGGGGGFAGDSSLPVGSLSSATTSLGGALANGGTVHIDVNGDIATHGANAHGVVAQSLGGGGMLTGVNGSLSTAAGLNRSATGAGEDIAITQSSGSIIAATGAGSMGIFAQAAGNGMSATTAIDITIDGTVTGGTGSGSAGIFVSGGSNVSGGVPNTITIGASGSVGTAAGTSGTAIKSIDGTTNVTNNGTITGSYDLSSGSFSNSAAFSRAAELPSSGGTVVNNGTIDAGALLRADRLVNGGILDVDGSGETGTTTVAGDFLQTGGGVLRVDVDALGRVADLLRVTGDAALAGAIAPVAKTLLPVTYRVMEVDGQFSHAVHDGSGSLVVDWAIEEVGKALSVTPSADFTPDSEKLSGNQRRLGDYLQRSWDLGGTEALAPAFGHLASREDGDSYRADLDDFSGAWFGTNPIQRTLSASDALASTMSCPVFEQGSLLGEVSCVWGKITTGTNRQSASSDTPSYKVEEVEYRVGGQKEVADDWFLAGTVAYQSLSGSNSGGQASSDGQAGDIGMGVKRVMGPWQFGAGLNLGYGDFDDTRVVTDGSAPSVMLTSDYEVTTVAGRLRATYEIPFEHGYVQPRADLDVIYTYVPGHAETGASGTALEVDQADQTVFALTPAVEVAGRFDGTGGFVLHPYVTLGVRFLSDDAWTVAARLQGAQAEAGTFESSTAMPDTLADLHLGLQVFQVQGWELNLEYGLQTGDDYVGQAASGRVAYRF
ncbi:MAG TPA: hypothetical protein VHL31_20025 [Geminicoccus sp.]|uniref:hypothetical protein n=1 Tax=Geminicoccus sp. TaxID=2024832 RepID=UPI002E367A6F|nr:hypothetical protein [Geminicoccus sp.]HEX2528568.1 hypothetical protein [Geminicoccus sp.]